VLDDTAQGGPAAMRDAEAFAALAQFSLWGNKSDLSLHASVESAQTSMGGDTLQAGTLKQLRLLQRNVLADCSPAVWQKVAGLMAGGGARARIDIVLDNAGYELFTDMCLAHWLVVKGACKAIKFHCKDIPWFVSDTSPADFHWLVGALQASPVASIARVGAIFQQHVDARRWIVAEHPFWTLPHEFVSLGPRNVQARPIAPGEQFARPAPVRLAPGLPCGAATWPVERRADAMRPDAPLSPFVRCVLFSARPLPSGPPHICRP